MIDQSEILRRSHVQFITLFFGNAEKPISWAKPAHFDFFAINCTVCSHIMSTGVDALRDYNSARGNVPPTVRRHWLATWIQMREYHYIVFASLKSCPNDRTQHKVPWQWYTSNKRFPQVQSYSSSLQIFRFVLRLY
jgi:hypothetical protein